MKLVQEIQFLKIHLLLIKHPLCHKILQNAEYALQSAASNDDEMELNTANIKRAIHEDSSEEEPTSPLPFKRTAPGSPTSGQNGTVVPKGPERWDLSKISTFSPNTPKLGRGAGRGDKSPSQAPGFSTITVEGSTSSAQGGRNRGTINRQPVSKPPGTIKTATKNQAKSKKKYIFINHGSQLHYPVEL